MPRRGFLLACVLALAACGGATGTIEYAKPQTVEIGSRELDGRLGVGFVLEVRRLRLLASGWQVDARIVNRTSVSWTVRRPHVDHGTKFGLLVSPSQAELDPRAIEATGLPAPSLTATSSIHRVRGD
jgi:hypothetical protein